MQLDNATPAANAEEYANFIPAGVRRAAERANALAAEYVAANAEPPVEPTPEPAPTPEPTNTTVVTDPPAPPAEPVVDWQQRYRTLQGKYDREVPALRGDVNTLRSQVETLTAQLEAAKTVTPPPAPSKVPDADVETYGEDLVTATRRWARAEVAGELEALRAQLAEVKQTTTTVQQETAQTRATTQLQTMLTQLDAHPEIGKTWRQVNDDPAFMTWLEQVDPFTGGPRMGLLRDAFGRSDVHRTAAFFKAYAQEHTALQPPPAVEPPTPQPGTGRPTLETFASPGRGTGQAPSGAPADKRIWTQASIAAFYRDRTHGKYQDRQAESVRLEQDLISAAAEGRIRP